MDKNSLLKKSADNIPQDVNYRDGYHYYFQLGQHRIHAFGSAKSGKEQVFVDQNMVAEKRSFGRKSCLAFQIDGNDMEVEFHMVNMFSGELHCTLIQNGTHVKTLKKALKTHYHLTSKRAYFWIPLALITGVFCGYYFMTQLIQFFN